MSSVLLALANLISLGPYIASSRTLLFQILIYECSMYVYSCRPPQIIAVLICLDYTQWQKHAEEIIGIVP
jgi:hypothetical protein